jgi:hypothetical protein
VIVALVVALVACVLILAHLVVALEIIHQRQQQRLLRALYAMRLEPAERVALTTLDRAARPPAPRPTREPREYLTGLRNVNEAIFKPNGDLDVAPVDA